MNEDCRSCSESDAECAVFKRGNFRQDKVFFDQALTKELEWMQDHILTLEEIIAAQKDLIAALNQLAADYRSQLEDVLGDP